MYTLRFEAISCQLFAACRELAEPLAMQSSRPFNERARATAARRAPALSLSKGRLMSGVSKSHQLSKSNREEFWTSGQLKVHLEVPDEFRPTQR
jgi:hypothetical protein